MGVLPAAPSAPLPPPPSPAYVSKSTLCCGHIPMDFRMLSISEQISQPRM